MLLSRTVSNYYSDETNNTKSSNSYYLDGDTCLVRVSFIPQAGSYGYMPICVSGYPGHNNRAMERSYYR